MIDLGTAYTDAALKDIEKQLKSVYNNAYKDILQKQKDFNAAYDRKEAKYWAKWRAGEITKEQFDAWKRGQVFQSEQWQAKKRQILDTLYSSNQIATKIINGQMTNVFTFNANYQSFSLEHGVGVNFGFNLYDSATVVNLIKNNPKLLPEWKINEPKDYRWNAKKLNRQINLGIIEGESLDKIARRLCDNLSTQNFNHMRTFARTAMTEAQNAGREFSLQEAQDKGIKLKKEWMCTLDGHTRTNHRLLDGQKRALNKPFEVDGMKIRYPGDPEAHPSMVYNCRCTMVGDVVDYPATYDRYDNVDGKPIKNMKYNDWVKAKAAGKNIDPKPLTFSHKGGSKSNKPAPPAPPQPPAIDRNWMEEQIPDDVFDECARNGASHRNQMLDALDETSDDYKVCFAQTVSEINYKQIPGKSGAFYRDSEKIININLDKCLNRDGNMGTLFHETGHAIDYAHSRKIGKRASATREFRDAVKYDMDELAKFAKTKEGREFLRQMLRDDSSKGVQDFFSAFKALNDKGPLKGQIPSELLNLRYNWCHSYDYYTRKYDPMIDAASELWANISGTFGDAKAKYYMQKLFPNSCGAFDNIIKKLADEIKRTK